MKTTVSGSEEMEKRYRPLTEWRRSSLKTIRKYNGKLEPEENSDDDMYTRGIKFKENEKYDIYLYAIKHYSRRLDRDKWETAVALSVTDEVVKFEYMSGEEKFTEWIETESDRIAPANTMVKNISWQMAHEIDSNLYVT